MPLLPAHFLVRLAHPCPYLAGIPRDDDELFDLPDACRLDGFPALDGRREFADVRLAWNEFGVAVQATVAGKKQEAQGNAERPRLSDGLTLWLDTRGDRTGHRATRTCHQFHFLAAGDGPDRTEPAFAQTKIHRALHDAPLAGASDVPFRHHARRGGYRLAAFLPAAVLGGFDPEQHPRCGVYYALRDAELGEQTLAVGGDFPFETDPSLWAVLELRREAANLSQGSLA